MWHMCTVVDIVPLQTILFKSYIHKSEEPTDLHVLAPLALNQFAPVLQLEQTDSIQFD